MKNPTFTFRTFKNIAIQQIKKKNNTIVFYGLLKNGRYQIPKGKLGFIRLFLSCQHIMSGKEIAIVYC